MKKFIIAVSLIVAAYLFFDFAYYQQGWYLPLQDHKEAETFITVSDDKNIYGQRQRTGGI